jgi:hypothetical protein
VKHAMPGTGAEGALVEFSAEIVRRTCLTRGHALQRYTTVDTRSSLAARLVLVPRSLGIKGICLEEEFMETQAQEAGDPTQEPKDLPTPRTGQDKGKDKTEDKKGFGHIGNKDVPSSKGTPEPHEIF